MRRTSGAGPEGVGRVGGDASRRQRSTHAPAGYFRGVGLDAEQVSRFEKLTAGQLPWRYVYSDREAGHLAAQPRAAESFCVAFCCKEALCKAIGEPYPFPEFECFHRDDAREQELLLSPGLRERLGVAAVQVRVDGSRLVERGEYLVEVYLPHRGASAPVPPALTRVESLQVAAVAEQREVIEREHFSPSELVDLGKRAVQSLAGALALKRALAGIWEDAGEGEGGTRDFELGHHASGAPSLVRTPAGAAPGEFLVSISHTRQWAYALAVFARGGAP